MSEIKDGAPAFPFVEPNTECNVATGMTLRDWFAGKAMQGMLSDTNVQGTAEEFAQRAYQLADAMLKVRGAA